jgi:uncharacterized protein YeaO (DUF488 family)
MIQLKRAYEKPSTEDGLRILVERLWPRGLTKAKAAIDLWVKDVAPSPELRKWFGHDPSRWEQFAQRYWKELKDKEADTDMLRRKAKAGKVTFIYAARDEQHNGALVLKQFIEQRAGRRPGPEPEPPWRDPPAPAPEAPPGHTSARDNVGRSARKQRRRK